MGVVLDDFGAIAAFRALQRIALLVVAEGLREFTLILQCLAERKTQVVAVDGAGRGRRFRGT